MRKLFASRYFAIATSAASSDRKVPVAFMLLSLSDGMYSERVEIYVERNSILLDKRKHGLMRAREHVGWQSRNSGFL